MHKTGKYLGIVLVCLGFGNVIYGQSFIDTVCAEDKAVLYETAPTAGSTYFWTVEGGKISSYSSNGAGIIVDWGLVPGIKKITVKETSVNGCPGNPVQAFVLVLPKPQVSILGPDQVCRGEIAKLTATGGADRYEWSNGSQQSFIEVAPQSDTSYAVTGYFGQCGTSASLHELQVKYRPAAEFDFTPKKPVIDEPIQFIYTGTPNVDNWEWIFREEGSPDVLSSLDNPEHSFSGPGIKVVKLFVSNTFGCNDTITKYIAVESGINVFVPSAFSPNADGLNSVFIPTYENVLSARMLVYDRWGETIFATESMTEGWDGNFKGNPVPDGVFLYVVHVKGKDNKSYVFEGTVTVAR